MNSYVERVLEIAKKRDGNQPEFLQALNEVLCSIEPIINTSDKYEKNGILERLIEPERVIMFRVPWVNDKGEVVPEGTEGSRHVKGNAKEHLQGIIAA